jgi:hypothetical protein
VSADFTRRANGNCDAAPLGQIVSKKNRTLAGPAEFVDPKVDTPSRGEQLPTLTGRDLGG